MKQREYRVYLSYKIIASSEEEILKHARVLGVEFESFDTYKGMETQKASHNETQRVD